MKFFTSNPEDLFTLIPKNKKNEFYDKVKETSLNNVSKGDDAPLTQRQILDICLILNGKDPNSPKKRELTNYVMETKFGTIFLN